MSNRTLSALGARAGLLPSSDNPRPHQRGTYVLKLLLGEFGLESLPKVPDDWGLSGGAEKIGSSLLPGHTYLYHLLDDDALSIAQGSSLTQDLIGGGYHLYKLDGKSHF